MTPTLRPAAELNRVRLVRKAAERERSHNVAMKRVVEAIEDADRKGGTSVNGLTYPDSVVRELEAKGYKVTYNKACGMGDTDSHTISWDVPETPEQPQDDRRAYEFACEINGGEYTSHHTVTCKNLVRIDATTVEADGVRISFGDPIVGNPS